MKPMTTLPGMDDVTRAARAAGDAARAYDNTPDDARWLGFRTAVQRVSDCMQTTIRNAPRTPVIDAMRAAASLMSEAAAIMNNASGRLSPGAEQAVVEQLIEANEQWTAAVDARSDALEQFVRTHDPDRVRPAGKPGPRQHKRRRR